MSIDPSRYTVGRDSTIEDVDLEEEDVRLLDGRRLTDELADKIARDAVSEAGRRNLIPGGKSLAGDGSHSPRGPVPGTGVPARRGRSESGSRGQCRVAARAPRHDQRPRWWLLGTRRPAGRQARVRRT